MAGEEGCVEWQKMNYLCGLMGWQVRAVVSWLRGWVQHKRRVNILQICSFVAVAGEGCCIIITKDGCCIIFGIFSFWLFSNRCLTFHSKTSGRVHLRSPTQFFKDKNGRNVSVYPCSMKRCWEHFFGIEKTSNCPKTNLVSIGQGHSTCYHQLGHSVFKTKI